MIDIKSTIPKELSAFSEKELIYIYNYCITGESCDDCPLNTNTLESFITAECRTPLFKFIGNYTKELYESKELLIETLAEQSIMFKNYYNEHLLCELKNAIEERMVEEFDKHCDTGTITAHQVNSAIHNVIIKHTLIID